MFMTHRPRKVKVDSLNTCYPRGAYILFGEDRDERKERAEKGMEEGRGKEGKKKGRGGDKLIVMPALRKMKQEMCKHRDRNRRNVKW